MKVQLSSLHVLQAPVQLHNLATQAVCTQCAERCQVTQQSSPSPSWQSLAGGRAATSHCARNPTPEIPAGGAGLPGLSTSRDAGQSSRGRPTAACQRWTPAHTRQLAVSSGCHLEAHTCTAWRTVAMLCTATCGRRPITRSMHAEVEHGAARAGSAAAPHPAAAACPTPRRQLPCCLQGRPIAGGSVLIQVYMWEPCLTCHSCTAPQGQALHSHHTLRLLPGPTSEGRSSSFNVGCHCLASSGFVSFNRGLPLPASAAWVRHADRAISSHVFSEATLPGQLSQCVP